MGIFRPWQESWSLVRFCPWYTPNSDGTDGTSWISKVSALAIDPNDSEIWYVGAGKHTRGQMWGTDSLMKDATSANPRGGFARSVRYDLENFRWG
ncbi:hypothetical protein EGM51_04900 [Verrucomicrobia bacterium S94]|nr:hypothetical protein EGM51_04900 [Verrucomicrobia bacterium S94]